jgi:hypothetical protein
MKEVLIGMLCFILIAYLVYVIGKFSFKYIDPTGHATGSGDTYYYILCGILSICVVVGILMGILMCYVFGAFIVSKF